MFSRLSMLAVVGVASVTAMGVAAQAQPTLTQTCAFKAGPLDGQTIDFSGIPGAVSVPVGDRCADMQGSSGVAVQEGSGAPPQVGAPGRQTPGRYYLSPGAPMGAAGNPAPGFSQLCRFNSGPRSGTTFDYSHTLGALPLAIGSPCADGASSGVIVAP
jgi:hypothetical protein